MNKKILIAYTDAGGGHKAVADALKAVIESHTPHRVVLMNPYKELIADVDLFARLTPFTDEDVYNRFVLGKGWNHLFCLVYFAATLLNVKLGTRKSVRRFAASWKRQGIDLVISVMPMSNQGLYQSVRTCFPQGPAPFLVVMTDMMETMKYTWFPREQDYFAVCPNLTSLARLLKKPHPPGRAFCPGGLAVHPRFYDLPKQVVSHEREKLGLLRDRLTGCVMYGGGGSERMLDIAKAIVDLDQQVQMIFLCGRNQRLTDDIRKLNLPFPHIVRTFTKKIPYYFSISDFMVGKPGPGTISEAQVMGICPVVDIAQVLPQERYNVQWLKKKGLGMTFRQISELKTIIRNLAMSKTLALKQQDPLLSENRAIFAFPKIVEQIFSECSGETNE